MQHTAAMDAKPVLDDQLHIDLPAEDNGDPTTRRLLGDPLGVQEQHARNPLSLVEEVSLHEASRTLRDLS